ncbi:MAG: hypothetical protein WAX57_04280 [Minisyncoccia bacterium]
MSTKKTYQPGDIVDLDDVFVSPAALSAWQATAQVGARALTLVGISFAQIPIEQGLILETGELDIFVEIPGLTRISMRIPPEQWRFR